MATKMTTKQVREAKRLIEACDDDENGMAMLYLAAPTPEIADRMKAVRFALAALREECERHLKTLTRGRRP